MKRELLETGIQNAKLDPRDGRMIEGADMDALCRLLSRMEESIQALEKRGYNLRELATRQDPVTARLPIYHVNWRKQKSWFLDRTELNEFLKELEEETGKTVDELRARSPTRWASRIS